MALALGDDAHQLREASAGTDRRSNLVTEAAPDTEATPPPPTGADLLAQQPPEVQEAVKRPSTERRVADLRRRACRSIRSTKARAGRRLRAAAHDRHPTPGGRDHHRRGDGRQRALDGDAAASGDPRNAVPHLAVKPQTRRHRNQPDDLHDEAHLPYAAPLARQPRDAGGRVLLPR